MTLLSLSPSSSSNPSSTGPLFVYLEYLYAKKYHQMLVNPNEQYVVQLWKICVIKQFLWEARIEIYLFCAALEIPWEFSAHFCATSDF